MTLTSSDLTLTRGSRDLPDLEFSERAFLHNGDCDVDVVIVRAVRVACRDRLSIKHKHVMIGCQSKR